MTLTQQEEPLQRPQPEAKTSLVVATPQPQAIQVSREWEAQLDLIRKTVAPGLNEPEFALFCHVARVRHLDPLQRQIHAVKRKSWNAEKNGYDEHMTIQTGIDGFRAIANRTGAYMPSDKLPLVEGEGTENLRVTVWVKKWSPNDRQWHEYGATAFYREFVQTRTEKNGTQRKQVPVAMWAKMPLGQTEKCAEAKALRRGWPEELGQLYVDEEMQQADSGPELIPPDSKSKAQRQEREVGTLQPSTEPNRGHGNEGMQRTETTPAQPDPNRTRRGVLTVGRVDAKMKNPTPALIKKAKDEKQPAPESREYFVLVCSDAEGNEQEIGCWDKKHYAHILKAAGKECEFTIAANNKGDRVFYNLEHIHRIGDQTFENDVPVAQAEQGEFQPPTGSELFPNQ